jgi:hypothetical protein
VNTFTEEDDLDTAFAKQVANVQQQQQAVATATATATAFDESMDDAGSDSYVAPPRQNFIRPAKFGEVIRLALLDPKEYPGSWKQAFTHARKGAGVFRCLDPKGKSQICCKQFGEAKLGYYTTAVQYTSADPAKGTIAKGKAVEIAIAPLKLSPYAYSDILSLKNDEVEGESIFHFDFVMGMESTEVVQGYNFKRASTPPRYRELGPDAVKNLLGPWADGSKLSRAIGKTLNSTEIQALASKLPSDSE